MTIKVWTFAESDCSPQKYRDYMLGQIEWAERVLDLPVTQWPYGSSHDIAREVLNTAHDYAADLILARGCFNANGNLVAFR